MANKVQPLTKVLSIILLVTILFTGALGISPYAFSTGYNHDDDDDHDDDRNDCDDDNQSKHDDDDDDCEAEPKPTRKATIILKKAVTTDNGAELVVFTPRIDGVQKEFDVPIEVDAGVPHMISEDPVDGFSPVLIAGDTGCPAMLDENFVLKKGEKIICTIYNDDDFDSSQTGGDGGIIFHRNSIIFTYMGQNNEVLDENGNSFDCSLGPCVELPPLTSTFIIHDMKVDRDSALVVINVFPVVTLGNEEAFSDGCRVYRL